MTAHNIESLVQSVVPRAIEIRRQLHQHPEIAYEEHRTAQVIRDELDRLGIPHIDGVDGAPTATIAHIGDMSKPCIALRADIDALPMQEENEFDYKSRIPGMMHACGHDGHTANLLGTAAVLKQLEDRLPVCVKLMFQPAEERGGGALRLVRAGVLDGRVGPKAQAVFGLHGWVTIDVGSITIRPGATAAASDRFVATFIGRGTHAASPHRGVDPIVTAAQAITNLQEIVTRDFDPTESCVVTVGKLESGTASNIIPDTAVLNGTVRTLNDEMRAKAEAALRRRCEGIAAANNCTVKVEWLRGYPPVINDPEMTDYVARVAKKVLGEDKVIPKKAPTMGGEDFAYYLEQVPGCFINLGIRPAGTPSYPPGHSSRYDFNDDALPVGIRLFVELALNFPV